jgi:hypothetical protein
MRWRVEGEGELAHREEVVVVVVGRWALRLVIMMGWEVQEGLMLYFT